MSMPSWLSGDSPPRSSDIARNRLSLLLAHERSDNAAPADFLPALQQALMAVILKYVSVEPQDIKVHLEQQGRYEVLEVNIVLPEQAGRRRMQRWESPQHHL